MPDRPEDTDPTRADAPSGREPAERAALRPRVPLRRGPVDCDAGTRRALAPVERLRRGPCRGHVAR